MLGMGITTVVATVGQLCKWKDDVSMSESSSLHVSVSLSKTPAGLQIASDA